MRKGGLFGNIVIWLLSGSVLILFMLELITDQYPKLRWTHDWCTYMILCLLVAGVLKLCFKKKPRIKPGWKTAPKEIRKLCKKEVQVDQRIVSLILFFAIVVFLCCTILFAFTIGEEDVENIQRLIFNAALLFVCIVPLLVLVQREKGTSIKKGDFFVCNAVLQKAIRLNNNVQGLPVETKMLQVRLSDDASEQYYFCGFQSDCFYPFEKLEGMTGKEVMLGTLDFKEVFVWNPDVWEIEEQKGKKKKEKKKEKKREEKRTYEKNNIVGSGCQGSVICSD